MQTRRHSRRLNASASVAESEGDAATAAPPSEAGSTIHSLEVEIPQDLDVDALQTLLPGLVATKPSPDAVLGLYKAFLEQAVLVTELTKEKDAARAEASRYDVELDQALQDQDVQAGQLRTALEEAQTELIKVQKEKDELETTRNSLQQQISSLTSNYSTSSHEMDDLRRQITQVQSEKRDLLGVVDTLREENTQREEDVRSLRTAAKELRTEVGSLQNQLAESRSNEIHSKFRLQSLEQELDLVRNESQRNAADLNALQESSSNDRRTKHAEIVRLQSQVDTLTQDKSSAESRLEAMRKARQTQETQLEDALRRIAELQTELAQQTTSFRGELETQKRLAELMDRRNEESRRRLEEIEQEWDSMVAKTAETEARLKEELSKERNRGDDLENRLEELRLVTDTMRPMDIGTPGAPRASTPTPGTPGSIGSNSFFLSPAANLAIRLQKGGRSYTEIYADYVKVNEELIAQKEETRRLESALAQILTDIEERAPLIRSQQQEYSRLQEEASLLASQLAQASSERDSLNESLRATQAASRTAEEENLEFQKQLSDLGRQVQHLSRELSIRDDPSLENIDHDDAIVLDDNDAEAVISNHLVLFRSLPQLQAQNVRLIKTARGLARQLEAKELEIENRIRKEESEALAEASDAVRDMEAELQRQKVLVAAHIKERDMYRSMLARQGVDVDLSNGHARVSSPGSIKGDADAAQVLQEQQALFESMTAEMGIDTQRLKRDLTSAQRERDQNIVAVSKANAQIEYLQERIRLSQTAADLQARELTDLQKRNQSLQDALSRAEIASYHVSEELREARMATERLRQESANIKAENTFLKTVEARLHEDNRNLMKERTQFQDLTSNLTSMHADLEKSGENEKRRLERQVKTLETQLQDLRDQVVRDTEVARHTLLQKDAEIRELHERLDNTVNDLHKSHESQSVAEATKAHLEARVEDLQRRLQGVKEKLSVYERLPSGASGSAEARASGVSDETILRAEVAELHAALKAAETDLAKSREHVEQFKSISEANEDALESLNATYEQFKSDTERELRARGTELANKTERLNALQEDLATAHREQMEAIKQLDTTRAEFANDKRMLEATIADLSTVEDRALSNQASVQEDLRRQAQIAQDAHDKYARELVAHAEAVKENTKLKEELARAQAEARESENAAEVATLKATNAESNWTSQRDALRKELEEVSARCMDLVAHNATLHQHLESVSTQAARIRQAAEAPQTDVATGDSAAADGEDASAELRGVITFVRREKEIAELQLDLHKQENIRLKAYSDRLGQTLEDTRKLLSEERERASRSVVSADQHAELLEKIEQLNLLRESNATLRLDSASNLKAAQDLQAQLTAAHRELEPLKERVRMLEAEVETRQAFIHRLEEDNNRLKNRIEQILSKHHRIDPEELQSLKDQLEAVTKERDEKVNEADKMRTAAAANKSAHEKLLSETRLQFGRMNSELSLARSERNTLRTQIEQSTSQQATEQTASDQQLAGLQAQITSLETALTQAKREAEEAKLRLSQSTTAESLSEPLIALQGEIESLQSQKRAVDEQLAAEQARYQEEKTTYDKELERLKKRDERLLEDNKKFIREKKALEAKVKQLEEAQQAQQAAQSDAEVAAQPADIQELIAKRVADLTVEHEAQQKAAVAAAVADARRESDEASRTLIPSAKLEEAQVRHLEEMNALENRLTGQHRAELKAVVEEASVSAAEAAITSPAGATVPTTSTAQLSPDSIETLVEDRLASAKAIWEAEQATNTSDLRAQIEADLAEKHREAINIAKENVAKELNMKMQLKDSMLAKARKELNDAKEKIESLNSGAITQSGAAARVAAATNTAGSPTPAAAAAAAGIPPKPVAAGRGTGLVTRGTAAGRGRGIARGGGTTGGVSLGRSGSQILQAVAEQTGGGSPGKPIGVQTSILGAAGAKRPRDSDAETPGTDAPKRARGGGPSIVRPTRGVPAIPKPEPSSQ